MGTVISVSDLAENSIQTAFGTVDVRSQTATLLIDQVLKGPSDLRSLVFRFDIPRASIGYRTAGIGEYRIFFLKTIDDHNEFTSPYYPSVPAVPGTPIAVGNVMERVVQANAEVLRSRDVAAAVKREAVHVLRQIDGRGATAVAAYRTVLQEKDESLRLTAAAALVAAGDVRALSIAESVLLNPTQKVPPELMLGLRVAISQDLNVQPSMIAAMSRLLLQGDAPTRQAASRALRRAHSPETLPLLVRALDDPDVEVAFNGVMGFVEATGERELGPSLPAFIEDREQYVSYWKQWVRYR
jgi:hypothetical protein